MFKSNLCTWEWLTANISLMPCLRKVDFKTFLRVIFTCYEIGFYSVAKEKKIRKIHFFLFTNLSFI